MLCVHDATNCCSLKLRCTIHDGRQHEALGCGDEQDCSKLHLIYGFGAIASAEPFGTGSAKSHAYADVRLRMNCTDRF